MLRTSDTIAELATALSKAQGSMDAPKKTTTGQVGQQKTHYADLAEVREAARKPLADNGLSVVQAPTSPELGTIEVTTRLLHGSGEWLELTLTMPSGSTPQTMGSAITYARRYSFMAVLGLAPEDDDGKAASDAVSARSSEPREPAARTGLTPAKALFNRVKDASANAEVAQSLRVLSEAQKKALTVREYESDRGWAQMVAELLDALTDPAAEGAAA